MSSEKQRSLAYNVMIGTGGVGSGLFFALSGSHTLGREESRAGRFLDRRDYCKLHIISHNVQALRGPSFTTIPIGRVGDDAAGRSLLEEMGRAGLDLRFMRSVPGVPTMLSICFTYPDGSGGNLTPEDSASARIDPVCILEAEPEFARWRGRGIALAAPEAPLAARRALLELGGRYAFLRVGSFVSGEMQAALESGMLEMLDLLAMNLDEAAALTGAGERLPVTGEEAEPARIVDGVVEFLSSVNPRLMLSITAGARGSWSWDGARLVHLPAYPTRVVSTAGAGDAHLSGIIAGLAAGLELAEAQRLGGLAAALAVASPHTIAPEMSSAGLLAFAQEQGVSIDPPVAALLGAG